MVLRHIVAWFFLLISGSSIAAPFISYSLSHRGLSLTQRGVWYRLPLQASVAAQEGKVTTVYWQLTFLQPLRQPIDIQLCCNSRCRELTQVAGTSQRFRGEMSEGGWQILLRLPGAGVVTPATQLVGVQVTLNSRRAITKGEAPLSSSYAKASLHTFDSMNTE